MEEATRNACGEFVGGKHDGRRLHIPLPIQDWSCHNRPMPKGPQGQKRPADVIGNAVHVMKIATGEITETAPKKSGRVRSAKAGGEARAATVRLPLCTTWPLGLPIESS
jgi:hypothetical protein